jgi:protein phosphatase
MGTTMTVAVVDGRGVAIGHVGDSRAYLARGGTLEQLTEDHSLVSELVRAGKLSPEEAVNHPQRSVITRALGTDPDVDVDAFTVAPEEGDIFLICSDGLSTMVGDEAIAQVLGEHRGRLDDAAKELIRLANRAGGEDNITVVAFELSDAPEDVEETRPMPAVSEPDVEDTLTEADRVPAIDTMVVPPAEAGAFHASGSQPQTPRRRRWPLVLLLLVVVLAIVVAAVAWYLLR